MAIRARVQSGTSISRNVSLNTNSDVSVKAVSIGGGAGTSLSALSDISIAPEDLVDGGVLSYDSASGKFILEPAGTNVTTLIGGTF